MQSKSLFQIKVSRLNVFSRLEVAEIPSLLMPGEQVLGVLSGFYAAGTATLCVTDKRLLLIDKKLFRMSYEDIRYQAISEVNYFRQLLLATVHFFYGGRELRFRSAYRDDLRVLAEFVESRMSAERGSASVTQTQPLHQILSAQAPDPIEQIKRWRKATDFMRSLQLLDRA